MELVKIYVSLYDMIKVHNALNSIALSSNFIMHCETNILHLTGFFQLCDFSVHDICIYEYLLSEHYLKRNYKDNYILENELT